MRVVKKIKTYDSLESWAQVVLPALPEGGHLGILLSTNLNLLMLVESAREKSLYFFGVQPRNTAATIGVMVHGLVSKWFC